MVIMIGHTLPMVVVTVIKRLAASVDPGRF
jgi:hypothetical protein